MDEWQWRSRTGLPGARWDKLGKKPEIWWSRMEYRCVQVVKAEDRGDAYYGGKKGWHWHALDNLSAIDTAQMGGPFKTAEEAMEASRYNQRTPYRRVKLWRTTR